MFILPIDLEKNIIQSCINDVSAIKRVGTYADNIIYVEFEDNYPSITTIMKIKDIISKYYSIIEEFKVEDVYINFIDNCVEYELEEWRH